MRHGTKVQYIKEVIHLDCHPEMEVIKDLYKRLSTTRRRDKQLVCAKSCTDLKKNQSTNNCKDRGQRLAIMHYIISFSALTSIHLEVGNYSRTRVAAEIQIHGFGLNSAAKRRRFDCVFRRKWLPYVIVLRPTLQPGPTKP